MHYLSLDTVIYRPDGLRDIVLCQYDDVMEELVTVKPSVQIQREAVIASPWMHQAARGNASLQMSFTLVRAFTTFARAHAWGLDLQEALTLHPEGVVTWLSCYYQGRPGRVRTYHATVDLAQPLPLTSDHDLGPDGPRLGRRPGSASAAVRRISGCRMPRARSGLPCRYPSPLQETSLNLSINF